MADYEKIKNDLILKRMEYTCTNDSILIVLGDKGIMFIFDNAGNLINVSTYQ